MRASLDSNILVYAADLDGGPRHRQALAIVDRALLGECVLTVQSLAEFFHVSTRKGKLSADEAQGFVDDWRAAFPVHSANEQALADAIGAVRRHRLSFWEAMLWATVQQAGCRLLLTEDLQDGRKLGAVTFVNPFDPSNTPLLDEALPPSPR